MLLLPMAPGIASNAPLSLPRLPNGIIIRVAGSPNLGNVLETIMIGIRNPLKDRAAQ